MYDKIEAKIKKAKAEILVTNELKFNAESVNMQKHYVMELVKLNAKLEAYQEAQQIMIEELTALTTLN